jgi:hypothetical protein
VLYRERSSTQWDSRARPAKHQHRRCIGYGKRPCLPTLTYWFAFVACSSFVTTCFEHLKPKRFRGLSCKRTPVDLRRSVVSFALCVQNCCKRTSKIRAPQLHRASDGYAAALQAIWHSLPAQREVVSAAPNADHALKPTAAAQYYTTRIGRAGRESRAERQHQNNTAPTAVIFQCHGRLG